MLLLSKLWTKLTWVMSGIIGAYPSPSFFPLSLSLSPSLSIFCTEGIDTGFSPSLSFLLPGSVSESRMVLLKCRFCYYLEWWGQ